MKLRDMIDTLRESACYRVEVRDARNYEIMTCGANAKGVIPYLDCEVEDWFPRGDSAFVVTIKENGE